MINRNAYHNAMRCGTLFYYTAARRAAAPLDSAQRNSAICLLSTQLSAALRNASRLCSTICLLSTHRFSSPRPSTPLNDLFVISATQLCESHLNETQRSTPQLRSTICLLSTLLNSALLFASNGSSTLLNDLFITTRRIDTRLSAPQLYSTICLLSTLLGATNLSDTLRRAMLLNSTICLLLRNASPLGYPPRTAPRLGSTLLNDLFILYSTLLDNSRRNSTQLHSTRLPAAHHNST